MSGDYSQLIKDQNNLVTLYPNAITAKNVNVDDITSENVTVTNLLTTTDVNLVGPIIHVGENTYGINLPTSWPYTYPSNTSQVLILGGLNPNPPVNGAVTILTSQNAWYSASPSSTHLGINLNTGTSQSITVTGMNGRGSNVTANPVTLTFNPQIAGYYRLQCQITVGYAATSSTSGLVFYWFSNTPGPQTVLAACYLGSKTTSTTADYGTAILLTTVKLASNQQIYVGYDNPAATSGTISIQSIWADIQLVDPFSP